MNEREKKQDTYLESKDGLPALKDAFGYCSAGSKSQRPGVDDAAITTDSFPHPIVGDVLDIQCRSLGHLSPGQLGGGD